MDENTHTITNTIRNILVRGGGAEATDVEPCVDPLGQDDRIGGQFVLTSPFGMHRISVIPEDDELTAKLRGVPLFKYNPNA